MKKFRSVIISAFLIGSRDDFGSHNKIGVDSLAMASNAKLIEYMQPWGDSVAGYDAVVIHDGLPQAVLDHYKHVKFFLVEPDSDNIAFMSRLFALKQFLLANEDVERIFFTDINDLGVVSDPFVWQDMLPVSSRKLLLCGEEYVTFGENSWFTKQYKDLPPLLREYFENEIPACLPLSCGLWGGWREAIIELLDGISSAVDYLGVDLKLRGVVWDMFLFNYVILKHMQYAGFKMEQLSKMNANAALFLRKCQPPFIHERRLAISICKPYAALSKQQVIEEAEGIIGWCDRSKSDFLYTIANSIAKQTDYPIGCELGLWHGKSLFVLCCGLGARSKMYGVDRWQTADILEGVDDIEHLKYWNNKDISNVRPDYFNMLEKWKLNVETLEMTSDEAHLCIPERSLSLLHIDDCHTKTQCLNNFKNYWNKMIPGGVIVVDDTGHSPGPGAWPGPEESLPWLEERTNRIYSGKNYTVFQLP